LVHRRNFGYDFGAYKDAIDALPNKGADLDLLLLLNDSVWFPTKSNSSLLSELATNEADVVAAQIFGEALAQRGSSIDQNIILGSYCLMFKNRALRSQAFQSFWRSYKMSSNKEITLRRGERGLSKALLRSGLQCAGVYSQHRFEAALALLDADDLRTYMRDAVFLDPKLRQLRAQLLLNLTTPNWHRAAMNLLIENSKTKNFIGSSPRFSIERLGVDVVKKNNEMLYRAARKVISNWLKNESQTSFDQAVVSEIIERADKDNLPKTVKTSYATY
jgi:lipopolysaccharide biosynthesis protein